MSDSEEQKADVPLVAVPTPARGVPVAVPKLPAGQVVPKVASPRDNVNRVRHLRK